MDTDYLDEPSFVHNDQGDRSAAVINVDLGKHVAAMSIASIVCGICMALSVVCAGIAWWAITEHRVTQGRLQTLMIQQDALTERVDKLEK